MGDVIAVAIVDATTTSSLSYSFLIDGDIAVASTNSSLDSNFFFSAFFDSRFVLFILSFDSSCLRTRLVAGWEEDTIIIVLPPGRGRLGGVVRDRRAGTLLRLSFDEDQDTWDLDRYR